MNYMDKVSGFFGLNLFDKFNIIRDDKRVSSRILSLKIRNPYYFTDEGIINGFGALDNDLLSDLIIGTLKVERL